MVTKILRDSTLEFPKEYRLSPKSDWKTYSSKERCNDYAEADAIFRRKRPNPLTDTPFKVTEVYDNSEIYVTTKGSVSWRGPPNYACASAGTSLYPITYLELENDPEFNLNRARHKISGANQNLGESLVELDQTINLIKKNLQRLGDIGSALKSGEWSKLENLIKGKVPQSLKNQRPSKRLASGYLEVMFGILPLMSSAHTAVEAYGKGILTRGTKVSAVSGQKRLNLRQPLSQAAMENVGRATFSGTVRNENLATLNSYGLINPLEMAWQRLPYSFVIDWFVPIGTILGSLTAEAGLSDVRQCITRVTGSTKLYGDIPGTTRVVYTRVPTTGIPIGNPFGRSAQLSLGKLISSVALIRQRFP